MDYITLTWPDRVESRAMLPTDFWLRARVELTCSGPLAVLFLTSSSILVLPEICRARWEGRFSMGQFWLVRSMERRLGWRRLILSEPLAEPAPWRMVMLSKKRLSLSTASLLLICWALK